MGDNSLRDDALRARLKHFVVDTLNLSDIRADWITDEEPLLGGRLGLDSLDALELYMGLEEEFGVEIVMDGDSRGALKNISVLADFIRARVAAAKTTHPFPQPVKMTA